MDREQFIDKLSELIDELKEQEPYWAGILCTVAAAIETNREAELASVCQLFIQELKKLTGDYIEYKDGESTEIEYKERDTQAIDSFIINKEGHS